MANKINKNTAICFFRIITYSLVSSRSHISKYSINSANEKTMIIIQVWIINSGLIFKYCLFSNSNTIGVKNASEATPEMYVHMELIDLIANVIIVSDTSIIKTLYNMDIISSFFYAGIWNVQDLNLRPFPYKENALTNWANEPRGPKQSLESLTGATLVTANPGHNSLAGM